MGFGLMFLGLFFLLPSIPNGAFSGAEVSQSVQTAFVLFGGSAKAAVGFLLIYLGCSKAYKHCTCFDLTRRMSLFGIIFSAVYFAFQLALGFGALSVSPLVSALVYLLYTAFLLGFFICFMKSVIMIATETGVEKIRRRGAVGIILSVVFLFVGRILQILSDIIPSIESQTAYWLSVGGFVAEAVFVVFALVVTFSCYMWICLEGDEDMPDTRKYKYTTPMDFYDKDKKKRGGEK
ncbi:MAG: hypothetical protein IJR55_06140 [Clostridia bacterium]|nr:hypothetical protein [Clostridia bacterium]